MMKEVLTEEKVKQRLQQIDEMVEIYNQHSDDAWTQGYLRGCAVTTAAIGGHLIEEKRAG